MIERIRIENFKSIVDLDLNLAPFNCLVGMNGAGKTTVLQGIDFVAQLIRGQVGSWLKDVRGWEAKDIKCKLISEQNIKVEVDYKTLSGKELKWVATFNPTLLRCTSEVLMLDNEKYLEVKGATLRLMNDAAALMVFKYTGSVLSALQQKALVPEVLEFCDAILNIRSLELLSPNLMRLRARKGDTDIGYGGEKLSAYLGQIEGDLRTAIVALLKTFYPNLIDYHVSNLRSGWKKLTISEDFNGQVLETEASHINDGLLRILAILAEANNKNTLLLLDEIENGINPEIVEKLVDVLVASKVQMLVTTHSPMILNYLDDDVARASVLFVYKAPNGQTGVRPFFCIQRVGEKLAYMGPGEAFVDTNLQELVAECVVLDEQERKVHDESLAGFVKTFKSQFAHGKHQK